MVNAAEIHKSHKKIANEMPSAGERNFLLPFCFRLDKKEGVWRDATRRFLGYIDFSLNKIANRKGPLEKSAAATPWTGNLMGAKESKGVDRKWDNCYYRTATRAFIFG